MKNYLLTGSPGVGKTTVLERVLARLDVDAGGFFTREMRACGKRTGFEIVTLNGERGILATVRGRSPYRVGRYRVNIDELERIGLPALERAARKSELVVIDEIGTMELFSERFRQEVRKVLDGERPLLAVIKAKGDPFLAAIKKRNDVQLFTVTTANRDELPAVVCEHILPIVKHREPS